jgi:prepilin-type N-terminal cleavage/methylation domain-containing protein
MKIFKFKNRKVSQGFTLIEALVSIALILIAVTGPLSLTFNALTAIRQSKNRVIASYLAEEIIENFKNYRDNFALSCSNLNITYEYVNQEISSMNCESSPSIIPPSYYNYSTPGDTDPQNIAWKIFLTATMGDLVTASRDNLFIDNDQFYFYPTNIFSNNITTNQNCTYLKYSDTNGYNCSVGDSTSFKRVVNITKLSPNTLKIKVSVIYFESGVFLLHRQKSLTITDYIYKR